MNQDKRLILKLLGPLEIVLEGREATGFDSDKVRALLIFLAVEADRPHRRERLAGLLWPDYPEQSARTNLRRALSNLRLVIGDRDADPPFMHISRQTIQFNRAADCWVDSAAFTHTVQDEKAPIEALEEAVDLYRGEFMEGFTLSDAAAFEAWILQQRQSSLRQVGRAFYRLAEQLEGTGQVKRAIAHSQRQIALDPYDEDGHRQLMRLLLLNGQAGEAAAQYQACKRLLVEELGTEPAVETTALYERIKRGEFEQDGGSQRQQVRGYKLRDYIGAGHFGAVYRAFQPVVSRDVAIKIILPQFADDPVFIRLFEAEAQTVARLEHPHIVPLYDYWREPGEAYLVMRWLRGGSLQASLARGPWNVESSLKLLDQIASALATAHRHGAIHRDIKPANILLDEEGNGYLSDFGIATMTGPMTLLKDASLPAEAAYGSLGYLSPEISRGEEVTTQTDIYSLGVVLYELLTGQHPFPGAQGEALIDKHLQKLLPDATVLRPDLPHDVDAIIHKATAKDPRDRYSSAVELAAALRLALLPGEAETIASRFVGEVANPYKGLRPFQEADAGEFYGREELVSRMISLMDISDRVEASEFLALVGPSGSGKSSVAKAGIIPALRRGAIHGSENWYIVEMSPGAHPWEDLEAALLRVAVNPPESMLGQLREDERGLLRAVKRVLPGENSVLLLVIDQFEELFTRVEAEDERRQFLSSLTTALTEPATPLRVVLTLRADFYDRPLQYPGISELVRANTEVILPLMPEELERAIARPAEQVGVKLESGLVAEMVSSVVDQPGGLPLLQFALAELFDYRQGNRMTLAAYQASGGVDGALSQRAEAIYAGLNDDQQEMTHQLFLRLVTLGEGVEDTRRRVLRSELLALQESVIFKGNDLDNSGLDALATVLETFGGSRILTFDHDPESREPTVEIAHEALLVAWDRLREWLGDGRDGIRLQRRLANAVVEWEDAGRRESYLLRGARLALFEDWADQSNVALTSQEEEYLSAGVRAREARLALEEARRQEDLEKAQELAETRTRANRRLRWLVVGLALILILAAGAAFLAWQQSQRSIKQARLASARELTSAALRNLDEDPERSILLALAAATTMQDAGQQVLSETEEALHLAIQADRLQYTVPGLGAAAYSPDGKTLATSSEYGVNFWDAAGGQPAQYESAIMAEPSNLVSAKIGTSLRQPCSTDLPLFGMQREGRNCRPLQGKVLLWLARRSALMAHCWHRQRKRVL